MSSTDLNKLEPTATSTLQFESIIEINNIPISLNALDLANDESKKYNDATYQDSNLSNNPTSPKNNVMTKSLNILIENNSTEQLHPALNPVNDSNEHIENELKEKDLEASQPNSYETEINRIRDLLTQKDSEISNLESKLNEQEQLSKQQIELLHANFTAKLEQTLRKFQDIQKDKTSSMVMKYAEAEKKNIDLNRSIELLQSNLADSSKEKQRLLERLEKGKQEIEMLNGDNDKKLKEILILKKDNEKFREQFVLNDAKENAAKIKLKNEIESHLNTKKNLEQVTQELMELKRKSENEPKCEETVVASSNENGGEVKSNASSQNDTPISSTTNLTVLKSNTEKNSPDKDKTIRELYALKSQLKDMFEERSTLRDRLQCMEQERKLQEISLSKYKETLQSQKQMNKELLNEILQLRELQETLTKEQSEKSQLEQKLALSTIELNDLQVELSLNQEKQNELLSFTSKLTAKNTELQSENVSINERLHSAQAELDQAKHLLNQSNESVKYMIGSLNKQLTEKTNECDTLMTQFNAKLKELDELTTKLADEQDENNSLKKKHAANMKDLTRQLQILKKKSSSPFSSNVNAQPSSSNSNSLVSSTSEFSFVKPSAPAGNRVSRNSSTSSLNDKESSEHNDLSRTYSNNYDEDGRSIDSSSLSTTMPSISRYGNEVIVGGGMAGADDVYVVDIDKQKLIEKIVKLQRELAKRNEKIDFFQDHVNQLTCDLKRKTKIIQAYAIKEDTGAFTSEAQDAIKREMSKKTGIMSALYKTNKSYLQTAQFIRSNEANMTMDLSLEINAKLQALLEDTLIKNITLKDNIETLSQEIARLSKENRQIKQNI